MILQSHVPVPTPAPVAPTHHHRPGHVKAPIKPVLKKPVAPKPVVHHKPVTKKPVKPVAPSKKTAARNEIELDDEQIPMFGLKQDGHIH